MNDFLTRLVGRHQGGRASIRPRLGSLFETAPPMEMVAPDPIMPDALKAPPPVFPAPSAASPHQEHIEAPPPATTSDHPSPVGRHPQPHPPILPHSVPVEMPAPRSDSDLIPVLPPSEHERRRRTVVADPIIASEETPAGPSPESQPQSPEPDLAENAVGSRSPAQKARPDTPQKMDIRQIVTTIIPAETEPAMPRVTELPRPEPILFEEPNKSPRIAETNLPHAFLPRQEMFNPTVIQPDQPRSPVLPRTEPLPALIPPSPQPPTIQVTIGRIDVRAQVTERPTERPRPQPPLTRTRPRPALSLDDYLKQRGGSP